MNINEKSRKIHENKLKFLQFLVEAKAEAMSYISPNYEQVKEQLEAMQAEYLESIAAEAAMTVDPEPDVAAQGP